MYNMSKWQIENEVTKIEDYQEVKKTMMLDRNNKEITAQDIEIEVYVQEYDWPRGYAELVAIGGQKDV